MNIMPIKVQKATFAAGCFWGVEAAFAQLPDVVSTVVGYTGGTTKNPTYEQVCTGKTGHAEAVQVTFDPQKISYQKLLDVFWQCHDPTQANGQGPDIGTQYRSAIFYHNETQKQQALKSKQAWQTKIKRPITTKIIKATVWYPAEEYHQHYYKNHAISCRR